MIAIENKWSGKRSGRKLGEREQSGGHRKRWSGNGVESEGSRNALSVERLFLLLTVRSHALIMIS